MKLGERLRSGLAHWRAALLENGEVEPCPDRNRSDLWTWAASLAEAHPVSSDALLAAWVAIVSSVWLIRLHDLRLSLWLLEAGLVLPLLGRRRYPVTAFSVSALVAMVQWLADVQLLADIALLLALYTVAAKRDRAMALVATAVLEVGAVMAAFKWTPAGSWIRSLVFLSGLVAAPFLLGTNLRSRRRHLASLTEKAERLELERDQQALIVAASERNRIAREMHDVIAHSLTVIISLADGANAKLHNDPERAATAIHNISDVGRHALGDTRRLLGILRAGGPSDGLAPQPGVAQIQGLIEQVKATGIIASIAFEGQPRPLPPLTGLTTYRIVQEATTNTVKHAVGATKITVTLDYRHDELAITVDDNGNPPTHSAIRLLPISGHGLAGMRERAAVCGGSVTAGPTEGGWQVGAHLPIARLEGRSANSTLGLKATRS